MSNLTLSPQALAAALNAELYRRGVPAFVRVGEIVPAPAGEGVEGRGWTFAMERSPVPLHDDTTASRFAAAMFGYERDVGETAAWAAERFEVAWADAPARQAVFIPSPLHAGAESPLTSAVSTAATRTTATRTTATRTTTTGGD